MINNSLEIIPFNDLGAFSEYVYDGLLYMQPDKENSSLRVEATLRYDVKPVAGRRRDGYREYFACLNTVNMINEIFSDGVIASYSEPLVGDWSNVNEPKFIEETDNLLTPFDVHMQSLWERGKNTGLYRSVQRGNVLRMWILRGGKKEEVEMVEEMPVAVNREVREIKKGQLELL